MSPAEKTRVILIEDEQDIARLIQYNLSLEQFDVKSFPTGEEGLDAVIKEAPDIVLLDLMLPGIHGLEICKLLRNNPNTSHIPILMVTAKGDESDIIKGLELGADDYITKPFSPNVLVARTKAILRRAKENPRVSENRKSSTSSVVEVKQLQIHPGKHEVLLENEKLELTPSEFQILLFLAKKPGWVFTRSQIVDAVRGENYAVTDRSIDVQVVGLRKKLGKAGSYIETVRGVGYRFQE